MALHFKRNISSAKAFVEFPEILFKALPQSTIHGAWTSLKKFIPNSQRILQKMNEILTFSNTISTHGGLGGAEVQKYSILPYFCDGDAIFDIVLLSEETNEK